MPYLWNTLWSIFCPNPKDASLETKKYQRTMKQIHDIMGAIIHSNKILWLDQGLQQSINYFYNNHFYDGLDYCIEEMRQRRLSLCVSHISDYLLDKNILIDFLDQGEIYNPKKVFLEALSRNNLQVLQYIIEKRGFQLNTSVLLEIAFSSFITEDMLRFIASYINKGKVKEHVDEIIQTNLDIINEALVFLFYEALGQTNILQKLAPYPLEIRLRLAFSSLGYEANISLSERIFFEACRCNITGIISTLSINPSIHHHAGLIIALNYKSTQVLKEILSDDRISPSARSNEPLIMAIKKGYVEAIEIILSHPRLDLRSLLPKLPIELYKPKVDQKIIHLIKNAPALSHVEEIVKILY